MEEEYGKDYKKKAASDWNVQGSIKHNRNKKSAAKNVFREVDLNGDEAISKNELSQYVESNSDLWAFLGENLGLDEKTCIDIATQVAFSLAKRQANETSTKQSSSPSNTYELSEKEFKAFFKHYVQSQKGSYEFFLRTIFAVYDVNGDGVLQRQEFENFLNIFYMSKNAYRTKLIDMPSKTKFMRIAEARLDKNKDGVLSFMEVRDLLQVAAVVTCNKTAAAK
jgi:Ca2+-binding EF-hand superfamily protein